MSRNVRTAIALRLNVSGRNILCFSSVRKMVGCRVLTVRERESAVNFQVRFEACVNGEEIIYAQALKGFVSILLDRSFHVA